MPTYFDDMVVGATDSFGSYAVTREEVIEFAAKYDPQAFHLDDDAAAASLFGRLAASGWHTAAMAMRMMVNYWNANDMAEASVAGAGMDELRWPRPVYPGDVLRCEVELLEKIESRSRPEVGIVKTRWQVYNQNEELVFTVLSTGLFKRRPAISN
ncbi:MAG: MaoC family dehydratase [Sphingobium sp.]